MMTLNKLIFVNKSNVNILLILEPWGEEYSIFPNVIIEIVNQNEVNGFFEVEYHSLGITVHGYEGSILEVYSNG